MCVFVLTLPLCLSFSLCNNLLQAKLQLMKQQAEETRQRIDGQKAEERQLQRTIAEADAEAARQKKELDQVKGGGGRVIYILME